jgi:hypothetical protein
MLSKSAQHKILAIQAYFLASRLAQSVSQMTTNITVAKTILYVTIAHSQTERISGQVTALPHRQVNPVGWVVIMSK